MAFIFLHLPVGRGMNAARKHNEDTRAPAPPAPPENGAETPAAPLPEAGASPVHELQSRLVRAFTPRSEQRLLRGVTMLLIVALSTWLAAVMVLSAA